MTMTKIQTTEEFDIEFWNYAWNLEKEWQSSLPKFTDKELLKIFPEAKKIIPEKIKEWERKRIEILDAIKKKLTLIKYKIKGELSQWFWREWVKANEGQELLKIDGHIVRLRRLFGVAQGRGSKDRITEEKIQQALHTPIENIANQHIKLYKIGRALVGLCPFHQEKHPSFYIYPETNSCWCYGCNQGGDVINFVRLLHGCSFREAVKYLVEEK